MRVLNFFFFFFFNDTATTEIYTLSLHDALPILKAPVFRKNTLRGCFGFRQPTRHCLRLLDRKSTRLNSSHVAISYAVFCLKKKKHYVHYADIFCILHHEPKLFTSATCV